MENQTVLTAFFADHVHRFSGETVRCYRIALNQFFKFSKMGYQEVRATHIRAWLADMEANGLKPRSIHLKLSALKSFYEYCMEENFIKRNPTLTVHSPRKDDSLPYYLSKYQLELLREHTRTHEKERERAIVEALYATGVRISELLNIKLEDIKWERKKIWIRKGKGNKERFVLFTHECEVRLKSYLTNRGVKSEYLFCNERGGKVSRVFVQKKFQDYSRALNFTVKPHTMRHTFAAHLAEKNMSQSYIQELLGHVNINSTHIYTRLIEQARKDQYDKYQL